MCFSWKKKSLSGSCYPEIETRIMFDFIKFLFFSENKATYRSIAAKHQVGTLRVYRLAHGKKAKRNKDYQILKSLQKQDIIEGIFQIS